MGYPPRHWRLRVSLAWMWGAVLGTFAFAPLFGAFVGLVGVVVAQGLGGSFAGFAGGAVVGLMVGMLWVAAPAMVLAPITAMLVTRANTDVDSRRYSVRVRRAVASVLGVASLPLTFIMTRGLNRPLAAIAFAMFPLFVVMASFAVGLLPVMFTREIFDPTTAGSPSVVRRVKRLRSEAKYEEIQPQIASLLRSGADDREIAAHVTWEARLDFDEALRRVAELRRSGVPQAFSSE